MARPVAANTCRLFKISREEAESRPRGTMEKWEGRSRRGKGGGEGMEGGRDGGRKGGRRKEGGRERGRERKRRGPVNDAVSLVSAQSVNSQTCINT